MERANAQSFATAFGCFAVFAGAYFALGNVIPLELKRDMPRSMAELSKWMVLLIFVVTNMIVLIRAATITNVDVNRSIYLALAILAVAAIFTSSAALIDRYLVLRFHPIVAEHMILIRPVEISADFFPKLGVSVAPTSFDDQNEAIVSDLNLLWSSEQSGRYAEIIDNNAFVATAYAASVILSRSLLLLGLSMLSWTLILRGQRRDAPS